MKSVRIDMISDVMCPWCAIGLASLNKALQALEGQVQVDLHFQPFELNPAMPVEGQDMREHLMQKYGISAEESDKNRAMITERGAALGFDFRFIEGMRMRNTFKAHQLLHWAENTGKQQALKNALFVAHFRDHQDISNNEILLEIVQQIGMDAQEAKAVLADERFAHLVRDKEQQWQEMGIHSVPAFILNEKYLISGGQPPETFIEALTKVAQE